VSLLREYIRELLKEDAIGFVNQMADLAANNPEWYDEASNKLTKSAGRGIKRAFSDNADHAWLSTIKTVHWVDRPIALNRLADKGKDELSTTMTLPGQNFTQAYQSVKSWSTCGLWISGRITLAANDMDDIYSGHYTDYMKADPDVYGPAIPSPKQVHRARSSGVNKLPFMAQSRKKLQKIKGYADKIKTPRHMELVLDMIPYVLDQQTWNPEYSLSRVNEALVDNWTAKAIIVASAEMKAYIEKMKESGLLDQTTGDVKVILLMAKRHGVPLIDLQENVLWKP